MDIRDANKFVYILQKPEFQNYLRQIFNPIQNNDPPVPQPIQDMNDRYGQQSQFRQQQEQQQSSNHQFILGHIASLS